MTASAQSVNQSHVVRIEAEVGCPLPQPVLGLQHHTQTTQQKVAMREALEKMEDAELLAEIATGNARAFDALVQRHAHRFFKLAYRLLGDQQEAEDAVQEAFLKLWRKPDSWQPDKHAKFTTWFYRVVSNQCTDYLRKKRPSSMPEHFEPVDERESQEKELVRKEQEHTLQEAIDALPDRQKEALNLCFYEGYSNQEAADMMGVKLKALQSLLMRAKEGLKKTLRKEAA